MSIHYEPPTPQELRALKERLKFSGSQMADLFGLASAQQWHKYCGGSKARPMSLSMLFLAGALLNRTATVDQIFDWCREVGAKIKIERAAETDGEPHS